MPSEKWIIEPGDHRTIDLELVRRLKVGVIGGKVDVIAHDEPGARIEISNVTGRNLRVEINGDALEVDHPQLRWDNFLDSFRGFRSKATADISILAPRRVALKLGAVNARTLVSEFTGEAKLSIVAGDLVLDQHTGDVDLASVSGEVSVSGHTGAIRLHTVSGDVAASGAITRFKADTVSGDLIVDALGTPDSIDTNSVSGELTVRFDPGAGARYRVNTISGRLLLDDTAIKGVMGKTFEHVVGELAGQWLELGANSVSGDIAVLHRTAAASDTTTRTAPREATV